MKFFSTRAVLLMAVFCFSLFSNANISPADGSRINYTQIFFEYDEVQGADEYVISIFSMDNSSEPVIIKNRSLACIVSGFNFGKGYLWRYEAFKNGQSIYHSRDFNFTIIDYYLVDTNLFKINVEISKPS